jgi:hypothetical protein
MWTIAHLSSFSDFSVIFVRFGFWCWIRECGCVYLRFFVWGGGLCGLVLCYEPCEGGC